MASPLYRLLLIVITLAWPIDGLTTETVRLQLNDDHLFKFAGYYAALDQGYFASENLEVSIQRGISADGTAINAIEAVLAGDAEFGIAGMELLYHPQFAEHLRIVAPIFQKSTATLFSLDQTPLNNLQNLVGKTVFYRANSSALQELQSLLRYLNIDVEKIDFVPSVAGLDELIARPADFLLDDGPSIDYAAKQQMQVINDLPLSRFGRHFYGDTLFTRLDITQNRSAQILAFLNASVKGWDFALSNREQMVKLISNRYPRSTDPITQPADYNRHYANTINQYLQYPASPIGYSDPIRWQHIVGSLVMVGALKGAYDPKIFNWKDNQRPYINIQFALLTIMICGGIVMMLLLIARGKHRALLLVIALTTIASTLIVEHWLKRQQSERQYISQLEANMQLRAQLEGALNNTMTSIYGLATHISAQPSMSDTDFKNFSAAIMQRDTTIRNIAAAPNLIVQYVYPLNENKSALGLDYRINESQREAAFRVRDRGEMVLAGPVELVQGGLAFIARAPVFVTSENGNRIFWGLVAAPIDANKFLLRVGLNPQHLISAVNKRPKTTLAIRGKDGKGQSGDVFYGDPDIFDNPNAIKVPISIGTDSWLLASIPTPLEDLPLSTVIATRSSAAISFIIFSILINLLIKQEKIRTKDKKIIDQNQLLLTEIGEMAQVAGLRIESNNMITEISRQVFDILETEPITTPFPAEKLSHNLSKIASLKLLFVMRKSKESNQHQETEIQIESKNKHSKWVKLIFSPQSNNDIIGAIQDITQQKHNENTIREQATTDRVTQLPNRWFFTEQAAIELSKAKRDKAKAALLFIDVDNFKAINDTLGHSIGDDFLRAVAARLKSCLRDSDLVARLGGDEFTALLTCIDDYSNAFKVSEQIIRTMNQPFMLAGQQVFSSVSVGISIFPDDASNTDTLLNHADQAMYASKKNGKNSASFFTVEMQNQSERNHWIYNELVRAIEHEQISVVYQPIFELSNGLISDCEALARWTCENGQAISPVEFIPVAENSGLISKLDILVLKKSLSLLDNSDEIGVSVNISPRLFHDKERGFEIWQSMAMSHAKKSRITVEITERLLVDDRLDAEAMLSELQSEGIAISLDDFGTGYSSLSYLSRFNVNKLKIDRSFVMTIGHSKTQETLIETILSMGEKLGIDVVAEGIETQEQLDFLRTRGCRYGQGFLLARPMTDAQLLVLLGKQNAVTSA